MILSKISPSTIAILVAALVVLAVGAYTDSGGFQLAGALILAAGLAGAYTQSRKTPGDKE